MVYGTLEWGCIDSAEPRGGEGVEEDCHCVSRAESNGQQTSPLFGDFDCRGGGTADSMA